MDEVVKIVLVNFYPRNFNRIGITVFLVSKDAPYYKLDIFPPLYNMTFKY